MIHPDVEKHIMVFEPAIQERFLKIRTYIFDHVLNVTEKLGYGVPGYYVDQKNIIYVACFKGHIGLYPGSDYIEKHKDELKDYKTSKGTIQIKHDQEIPFELLNKILTYKG